MAKSSVVIKFNKLPKILTESPKLMNDALGAIAFEGESYCRRSMQQTQKQEDGHSVPGAFPAIQDAALVNSVGHRPSKDLEYEVHSGNSETRTDAGVDYAIALEYGTKFMAARPFMQPTADYMASNAKRIASDYLKAIEEL